MATTDYKREIETCKEFLDNFSEKDVSAPDQQRVFKYRDKLARVAARTLKTLDIALDDVIEHFGDGSPFVRNVERNVMRYVSLFCSAVDELMPDLPTATDDEDVLDVLQKQRYAKMQQQQAAPTEPGQKAPLLSELLPDELRRRYELRVINRSTAKQIALREIKSKHIGQLVSLRGIVTRVTEVKPLVTVVTYVCSSCSQELYQEVTAREFTPVSVCQSSICREKGSAGSLSMQTRGSKFLKYQEIRVQEMTDQVPMGHIPRTLNVHARGELTRQCAPGDIVSVQGAFLPTPYTGGGRFKAGLLADTYIEAMHIFKHKKTYANFDMTDELQKQVDQLQAEGDCYDRLARSIAPEIYGHEDVKKALLLLMVGGVTRQMADGMKIRGDLNVCLMGDPGVAKSQLLKHISTISPRGVYTSGKGSSGVGLTAAVLKDPITNDLILEGGSLVLADKGICCIDEFDKMEDADRTAIHEVMEQQTISIAKAGITTTLNARTSILAAANPAFGRYNIRRSPSDNINLPAALLSRFDLLFLLLDRPNLTIDMALADHVTFVHRHGKPPDNIVRDLSAEFIRAYVSQAKRFDPTVPKELTEQIVEKYVQMREQEANAKEEFTYTTARSLLAILRLGTALARLRFSTLVSMADILEALRLIEASKLSLVNEKERPAAVMDPVSAIFATIRTVFESMKTPEKPSPVLSYDDIVQKVIAKGYTQVQLDQCLHEYEQIDVLVVSENKREI
eukprot:TRINITY_DN9920_c0_g1_i1.p1 TRINITY_DN9920_c0_g1~~TRINITY_DN9920_c0_g1_i1.p1  ORF type:complete len:736 (-),score=269.28 TRINITY_DN9920_c0_g1_i1:76-2283(-)